MMPLPPAYARERLLTVPVLAASVLLGLAALPRSVSSAAPLAAAAFLLVAQFRIWDDIEDLAVDTRRAPWRILVRARSIAPVVSLAIIFAAGATALLSRMPGHRAALVAYTALTLGLLVYYRVRRRLGPSVAILLLKYPAIALILGVAGKNSVRSTTLAMSLAYAAACSFEYLHDRQSSALSRESVLLLHAVSLTATLIVSRIWR